MKTRVAVLRGGPSSEYDISLKSGATVLRHMPDGYIASDILIDKDGRWHMGGIPMTPDRILRHHDVVFNALHGSYGEDGTVQRLLEQHNIPFTGSGSLSSAVAMHKGLTREQARKVGIRIAHGFMVSSEEGTSEEIAKNIFNKMAPPWVIKPPRAGSSVGVLIARSVPELIDALENSFPDSDELLIEEFLRGREATVSVVEGFRGQELHALMPVEIIPPGDNPFFDYDAKYSGKSKEICPSTFSNEIKRELEELALKIHRTLNLRHYSRSDFIIRPSGVIYFLEVNTLPGLTEESLLPKALKAAGSSLTHFIKHVIDLAKK